MNWKKLGVQKLLWFHSTLIQNDDLNDYIQNWMLALSLLCIKYAKKVVVCRYLTFELRKMSWFPIHEIAKKYFHANCIFIIDRNCRHHIFLRKTMVHFIQILDIDYIFAWSSAWLRFHCNIQKSWNYISEYFSNCSVILRI